MPSDEKHNNDELVEKIKILATDDEKIKSFGELFTNDSSREILQLLFNNEMTANQIAQQTKISLQLVKYHLNKLQNLGVVKIIRVEKNTKSQDMKVYSASKFSIVIVPPSFSERTKESKLLVRSFRHIYKVAGFAVATGMSGFFSLLQIPQNKSDSVNDDVSVEKQLSSTEESDMALTRSLPSVEDESQNFASSVPSTVSEPRPESDFDIEFQNSDQVQIEISEVATKNIDSSISSDFFIPLLLITLIFGSITIYYLWKFLKNLILSIAPSLLVLLRL